NASVKLPAALTIMLSPWLSAVVTYKLYVFVAAIVGPACVPLAARWLGFPGRHAVTATTFGILLWWVSGLRWFHTAGMVSFVFAAYLALPFAAFALRYLTEPLRWPAFLLLAGTGTAAMFLHPLFPI